LLIGTSDYGVNLSDARIIVVDDDAEALGAFQALLSQTGARVEAVGSVVETLRVLRQVSPDAIVSDIAMPEDDGFALVRAVRAIERQGQRPRRLAVIAVTGVADASMRERALDAGFDAYLTKPVDADSLIAILVRLLSAER
jgi:CheY-like chemotaxis protein